MSRFNDKPKSNQEFFDNAWQWLITENNSRCAEERSGKCHYRLNNKTCVIGAMIPDDIYKPTFEGNSIDYLLEFDTSYSNNELNELSIWFENVDRTLMLKVQNIHDVDHTQSYKCYLLREIAKEYNLVVTSDLILKA